MLWQHQQPFARQFCRLSDQFVGNREKPAASESTLYDYDADLRVVRGGEYMRKAIILGLVGLFEALFRVARRTLKIG